MEIYRHPGLRGLEIWHGLVRHTSLFQLRGDRAAYYAGLDRFLAELHAGTAATAGGDDLRPAAGFDRLLLAGGDAVEAARYLTWPNELAAPGPFAARAGVHAVWAEYGWRRPLAIDLGQSRLKWYLPDRYGFIDRDPTQLPHGGHALDPETGRARLRDFLHRALVPGCDGVLLALPTAIGDDGVAESATYPGLYGSLEPVFQPLFGSTPWVAVNDAVLTARGFSPPPGVRSLMVTLGFGAGAALWH